jgi:hypothetical protein
MENPVYTIRSHLFAISNAYSSSTYFNVAITKIIKGVKILVYSLLLYIDNG